MLLQKPWTCRRCEKEQPPPPPELWELTYCDGCKRELIQDRIDNIPKAMSDAGVPMKYVGMPYETPEWTKTYIPSMSRGVFLTGPSGVGKTVAACLMMREWMTYWIKQGKLLRTYDNPDSSIDNRWRFISFPHFVMQLQNAWRDESGKTALDRMENVSKIPFLIIDDLGAEKLTDYIRQAVYFLVNEREQWCRPSIITTNFSLKQLDDQFDSRISSRIAGTCDIREMRGPDLRLRK